MTGTLPKLPKTESWGTPWFDAGLYRLDERGALPGLEAWVNHSVLKGGKRLRPILMAEFGALFGITAEEILPFARAAEQVHSATLAHDDVIDGAELRRGVRTLNARVENRRAVLGGDYLLAEGIFEVVRQNNFTIVESLSATLRELVTGELLQNDARGRVDVSEAHLLRVAELKTGSLFRWCCGVPVALADAGPEAARLTREFAGRLGVAFQWMDDLLDFSATSGKPFAQDLREGLVNSVSCRLLTDVPSSRSNMEAIFKGEREFAMIWSAAELRSAVESTRREAQTYLAGSRRLLQDLVVELTRIGHAPRPENVTNLERMMDHLERREK